MGGYDRHSRHYCRTKGVDPPILPSFRVPPCDDAVTVVPGPTQGEVVTVTAPRVT